jgi:hypothetical protein
MRKKDLSEPNGSSSRRQWRVYDVCSHKSKHYNIRPKSSFKHTRFHFGGLIKGGLTVLISVLIIFTVVKASTIKITPPSGAPVATFYSLSEIYNFIASSTPATVGSPALDWSAGLEDTGRTLTEIYNALAGLIDPTKLLSGTTYLGTAGTIANNGEFALTASSTNQSVTAGYYSGGTLAGDANLAVGNIRKSTILFGLTGTMYGDTDANKVCSNASAAGTLSVTAAYLSVGNTWCSTAGTLLANLFNGTCYNTAYCPLGTEFPGGSQANGGVDDYNNATTTPSNRYSTSWTQCNASAYDAATNPGGNYCNTGAAGADAKDNSTGLVWSLSCNGAGCDSFSDSSPITYAWNATTTNNYSTVQAATSTASGLCTNGDHQQTGWYLPHQKQLMQAYIDGSYGNLEASGVSRTYWSATTKSYGTTNAWYTYLSSGFTTNDAKTNATYVRCVR